MVKVCNGRCSCSDSIVYMNSNSAYKVYVTFMLYNSIFYVLYSLWLIMYVNYSDTVET